MKRNPETICKNCDYWDAPGPPVFWADPGTRRGPEKGVCCISPAWIYAAANHWCGHHSDCEYTPTVIEDPMRLYAAEEHQEQNWLLEEVTRVNECRYDCEPVRLEAASRELLGGTHE